MLMDKAVRPYLVELIGTFVVVLLSAGAVIASHPDAVTHMPDSGWLVGIALVQGFVYAAALAATVHISGGYLNPAVTLMLYVYKKFELGKTLGLIAVQLLGAAFAGGVLALVLRQQQALLLHSQLGTPHVHVEAFGVTGLTPVLQLYGIGLELAWTFVLTFVIFATLIDPRAPRLLGQLGRWLSPLWVGLALVAIVLVGFSWTGAAANPARYFGTVIWQSTEGGLPRAWQDHVVYWIGPIVGALLAGGAYMYLILPQEDEHAPATTTTTTRITTGAGSTLFRSKR
jgi:MIP family channel proteins